MQIMKEPLQVALAHNIYPSTVVKTEEGWSQRVISSEHPFAKSGVGTAYISGLSSCLFKRNSA